MGEILGMVLSTWWGWGNAANVALSVGLAFFLLATVLSACFIPSSRIGDLEGQMRAIQRKRRPRTVKVE